MPDDTVLRLWCLVKDDPKPFKVIIRTNNDVDDLKELIHEKRKDGILRGIDAADLKLWKVSSSHRPSQTLWVALGSLHDLAG